MINSVTHNYAVATIVAMGLFRKRIDIESPAAHKNLLRKNHAI